MRILVIALLALGFWTRLGLAAEAQSMAPVEPPAGAGEASVQAPATPVGPDKAKPQATAAQPEIWEPAVIHAEDNGAYTDGIAAVVNDISVSEYEVRQRLALFLATSGIQPAADGLKRIRAQILTQLEDEKLELQEAIKKHITVSPAEVDAQISRMLGENHLTEAQLREVLANAGASEEALRGQITAQIAWQKTVQDEYQDRINITPGEVAAELARYAEGADKPHYLVSEIFFQVDNPDKDADALK
ncbi:MAG: SurA N-terminal domain-containing protein, partial [Rhizomicrobium sp.]